MRYLNVAALIIVSLSLGVNALRTEVAATTEYDAHAHLQSPSMFGIHTHHMQQDPGAGAVTLWYQHASSGWGTSTYLHYNADNKGWNSVPGILTVCPTLKNTTYSCTNRWSQITVRAKSLVFVLTNGKGDWDNANGENYVANHSGLYSLVHDSVVTLVESLPSEGCPGYPKECSGHGTCHQSDSKCHCSAGFTGASCESTSKQCPGSPTPCNGHGTCNMLTGKCTCTWPYSGSACEHHRRSPPGHGNHTGFVTLLYYSSWSTVYLHDNPDGRGWNAVPGSKFSCPSGSFNSSSGGGGGPYPCQPWHEISVQANSIVFVLTNGAGAWDNNGGHNYVAPHAGAYSLKTSTLTEIIPYSDGCPGSNGTSCSGHGSCNTTSGHCQCTQSYFGPGCETFCDSATCGLHASCGVTGVCGCSVGWAKCDGQTGCMTNVGNDTHNCGQCGKKCQSENVKTSTCHLGVCQVTCQGGFTPCPGGTCRTACDLPGCNTYNDNECTGNTIITNAKFKNHSWQTPKPGTPAYHPSYQSMHAFQGYPRLVYSSDHLSATVHLIPRLKHASSTVVHCSFDNGPFSATCNKTFHKSGGQSASSTSTTSTEYSGGPLAISMQSADGVFKLALDDVDFHWDHPTIHYVDPSGDYRNGQKGAIIEMFGWRHVDIQQECEFISKAGYMGVKFFPAQEQLMASGPFQDVMNPWYFMYQPVSYRLQGRLGTRDDLRNAINTCRKLGVRAYADAVVNHMTGNGNDVREHHRTSNGPNSCTYWAGKNSSADFPPTPGGKINGTSPFFTQGYGYRLNDNSQESPMQEYAGVPYDATDFHCERALNSWTSALDMNAGWLVGLVDLNTEKDYVRQRIADYMTDLLSIGFSGFRMDAAKQIEPADIAAIFGKLKMNMGGRLPEDFVTYLEVLTGGEGNMLYCDPNSGYSYSVGLVNNLTANNLTSNEIDKIKLWYDAYPKQTGLDCGELSMQRKVIENDDADQQTPASTSRDMGNQGTVLVIEKDIPLHRHFEKKLFLDPNGASDNNNDFPIRLVLSSFWLPANPNSYGVPDGNSRCDPTCTVECDTCDPARSMNFTAAYRKGAKAYDIQGRFTRVHRDGQIINAMRSWMHMGPVNVSDWDL